MSPPQAERKRSPDSYIAGVLAAGALVALAAGIAVGSAPAPAALLYVGALALGLALLHGLPLPLRVGDERLTVSLEECVLLLAFATVAPPLAVLVAAVGVALAQLASRRALRKVAFNTGASALAAGFAALAQVSLVSLGAHPLLAAVGAVVAYAYSSNVLVAALMAMLGAAPTGGSRARRLVVAAAMQAGVGAVAGVVLYALWGYHPATLVVAVPIAVLARRHARLLLADEEAREVARKTAALSRALVKEDKAEDVAPRVLRAVGDILPAGSATIVLGVPHVREWHAEFAGGAAKGIAPIEAPLTDADGARIGTLRAHPAARNRMAFDATHQEVLSMLAGQASVAIGATTPGASDD